MATKGSDPSRRDGADRLRRRVEEALAAFDLIGAGDRVLAAVSGGPDSTALLVVLAEAAGKHGFALGAAHLDHGLRPEAEGDAAWAASLAARLGLPFHHDRADVASYGRAAGISLEEAGRELRYRFLEATAAAHGYTKVALGHHADDNAETLLLNLLRGSGRRGLGGIPPRRAPFFIRPLILARRREILDFLARRGIVCRADRSNADPVFDRNRLRLQVIPEIERAFRGDVRRRLSRTALILRAEEEWLEELTGALFLAAAESRPGAGGGIALRAEALQAAPAAALRRVVRRALAEAAGSLRGVGFAHVEAVVDLLRAPRDAGPLHLPGGMRARRRAGRIELYRPPGGGEEAAAADYAHLLDRPGEIAIPQAGMRLVVSELEGGPPADLGAGAPQTAYLDADSAPFPWLVRNFRPGDRFHPLGAPGVQKLKKYFNARRIPAERRRRLPLVLSGGRIVWVAGERPAEAVRVGAATRRILKVEARLAPG